jgi:uncharacterized protein YjiS (DUF1127 family)
MLTTHFAPSHRTRPLLSHWVERGARAMATWRHRRAQRKTVRILNSLDCRTLKDIGVAPGEIESMVYGDPRDRIRLYRRDWRLWTAS